MKSHSEIEGLIRDLICSEFNRRIDEATQRHPQLCINNYRHPLDLRKSIEGEKNEDFNRITDKVGLPVVQTIGLCLLESNESTEWGGTICEDPIDAKKCPYFTPTKDPSKILVELEEDLKNTAWVREHLPEVFTLLWVIGKTQFSVPWWKRLLFWFKVIRVEPVLPSIDPSKLLPSPPSSMEEL
jgi:hypothetical protein